VRCTPPAVSPLMRVRGCIAGATRRARTPRVVLRTDAVSRA